MVDLVKASSDWMGIGWEFFERSVGLDEPPTPNPTKSGVCVFVNYPVSRLFEIW